MGSSKNVRFLCPDRYCSPSIGVPVYVKDEVLEQWPEFPREHRGGIIIADMSFEYRGQYHYVFLVRHKHMDLVWQADEPIEIGGVKIPESTAA